MNTNHLKRFAQEARKKLIEQIGAKLELVLTSDSAKLREKASQVKKLQEEINATSKAEVIDKVAYTWFNRLMALRFMDANDYQLIGVRVVTPKDNYTLPEILDEAKQGNISDELPVNQQHIYDVLDGKTPSNNPQNEAYKELLIGACNHLNIVFPFLFEKISDYSELLLPDDLISEFSIIQDISDGMNSEDCQEVEIIGWLYQFYISEKKDAVFASKSKVEKEDIPAATQLFTPRWIVEYMVQNTVGKLWLQNNPNSNLRDHMPYFIESPSVESYNFLKINSVEEITMLDPACGSGHILVYGFELLTKIYEEEGYNPSEISKLIIEKNLFGFEIDERASQLAGMSLMIKARNYHRRVFRKKIKPNIMCYQDLKLSSDEIKETFQAVGVEVNEELMHDFINMNQAKNLGSLIVPHTSLNKIDKIKIEIDERYLTTPDVFLKAKLEQLQASCNTLKRLANKYYSVVANPPYMGSGKMNKDMSDWVKIQYPDSKADLFACFIERSLVFVPKHGYNGLVTMESWMFLSSFESLRKKLINEAKIVSLSHFGWHIMRIAFGTVSFILEKNKPYKGFKGVYSYMEYDNINREKERPIKFPVKDNGRYRTVEQNDFKKIPRFPIAYSLPKKIISSFEFKTINNCCKTVLGMNSTNNELFVRFWTEISNANFNINAKNHNDTIGSVKWYPYNKGGEYRRWYGNRNHVINWKDKGSDIHKRNNINFSHQGAPVRGKKFQFKESITWSFVTSGSFAVRYTEIGAMFDVAGSSVFVEGSQIFSVLAFLNSCVATDILKVLAPTLNFQVGNISSLPISSIFTPLINKLSISCVDLSKKDWNSREISWKFELNEIVRHRAQGLEEAYDLYKEYWERKFFQLHTNEEELNRQFIGIYGLQEELSPEISLGEITILKEETYIVNNQLVFDNKEVFTQFMSYAVGCIFGRYSLDKEGLILANQGETLEDYLTKVGRLEAEVVFLPDDDNIIPILDDEWFEDDIVNRFNEFLKVSFGKENFEKNLHFVEDCLGKDVRKYFVKDFYKDHVKRYKKRPIYWQFSSPKGSFNVLIYMHRYTPDTLNQILNGYLKEYREKLKTHIESLESIMVSGSSAEQTKASKEKDKLKLVVNELLEYERDVLYPLAIERIAIDLDDGVLVNYNKFGTAIKKVAGLNDKKAKDKVLGFDWIDVKEIR